jgi:hypothetical protein
MAIIVSSCEVCVADTHNAASCNGSADNTKIATAISAATAGDTVVVPAGSCTFTGTVTVNKNITLDGTGVTVTYGSNGIAFSLTGDSTTSNLRFTGFTLTNSLISWNQLGNASAWLRIDHITQTSNYASYWATPWATKNVLIDNNTFTYTGSSEIRMFMFWGESGADPAVWREDSAVGTANNVFIEYNTFNGGTGVTSGNHMVFQVWWAGRIVFRHNTVINFALDIHDFRDSSQRGGRNWEIYENTFTRTSGVDLDWMVLRGGTGVIYNNTLTETSQVHGIHLMAYSAVGYVSPCCCMTSTNGHTYVMDGVGRGKLTGTIGSGDSILEAACKAPNNWSQELEPAYFWGNTRNGTSVDVAVGSFSGCLSTCGVTQNESDAIQVNRDYYNISRPSYTAYSDPHPLVGSAVTNQTIGGGVSLGGGVRIQ